jgi:hypothetical protein
MVSKLKALPLLFVLMLVARVACAALASCTITGTVYNADGSPDAFDTITINPYPTTQVINNQTVTAQPKSVQTDVNGNVTAFSLVQNLNVYVTFHNTTAAAVATYVPNATTATFGQFLAGTLINSIPTANGGLDVTGSIVDSPIGTPSAPTVTVNTTGGSSYEYFCVAQDYNLNQTIPSSGTTVTNAASTPNNTVQCGGQTGALSYLVLKTNTSTELGSCATISGNACSVTDVGQSTSSYSPQTTDNTGSLYFANNSPIYEKTTGGPYANLFYLDTSNILQIGGSGVSSINFNNPTNIGLTFTHLSVTGLSGQTSLGLTTAATTDKDEVITEIASQSANPFELDSSVPSTLFDIEKDGSLDLYGSTSGHAHVSVPATAGTPSFVLPSTNGTSGYYLGTDGSGNTSWQPASAYFGGSVPINASTPGGIPIFAVMKATRALTVDNCSVAWTALGSCSQFPIISIADYTASTTVCIATGTNTSTVTTETVSTSAIPSGDQLVAYLTQTPTGCTASPNFMSIGIAYH